MTSLERPLRFCMITTFYPPYNFGGDGIFVYRLSNELARRGHRVDVIHCTDSYRLLARQEPRNTLDNHPNVTIHRLASPFGMLSPLLTQQTGMPLAKSTHIRRILATGFDVIHYHNVSLVGGPQILECGQGIKLYTMHEYWLVCQTHVLFKYNRAACTKPHCLLCSLIYKRPPQWWRYTRLLESAIKHVDLFLAPSRFGKAIHFRMGLNAPIVDLPNFAPPVELADLASGSASVPYFLFVGRLEKMKGLQTVIPLFRNYRQARLLVAGRGSYEPQLREVAAGSPNIEFLGSLSEEQLQSFFRRAIAVIVPSICFEAFPLVIIESFRQQTPAIVRNLGGLPEIIEESGGGVIYNTEEELVAAIDRLASDSSPRTAMGMRGYQAYQQKWTTEAHLRQYFALINEIAERKAGAGTQRHASPQQSGSRDADRNVGGAEYPW